MQRKVKRMKNKTKQINVAESKQNEKLSLLYHILFAFNQNKILQAKRVQIENRILSDFLHKSYSAPYYFSLL
jgi:hypothetical protein